MSHGRLDGQSIVILGGTSGMGLSAALACQREGARVVVAGRDDECAGDARERLGARTPCLLGEATDPAFATRVIGEAVARTGRLDGLFHVAGGSGRRFGDGPLDQITDEGWRWTLDANLTSLFLANRAAVRQFLDAGVAGSVVNMASVLAYAPAPAHFATHAYAAAKAAVVGLTTASAAYYAPHGIRFNVVAPGLVDTPMAQRAVHDAAIVDYVARRQPLDGGRVGRADDVDGAVVYLLSRESRFVTGQLIAVDGGWSVTA